LYHVEQHRSHNVPFAKEFTMSKSRTPQSRKFRRQFRNFLRAAIFATASDLPQEIRDAQKARAEKLEAQLFGGKAPAKSAKKPVAKKAAPVVQEVAPVQKAA
jgi:hypothetical protein